MTECRNEMMRDLLPLLAHGSLAADAAAGVRAHIAGCAACTAELALLETSRLVLLANAARVDTDRIVAALRPSALKLESGGASRPPRRRPLVWMSRQYLAAAASLLLVASLSLPLLRGAFEDSGTGMILDSALAVRSETTAAAVIPPSSGLTVGDGLADLSDDDLVRLLDDLEAMESTVAAEPAALSQAIVDPPEVP